jgi:hypothetical protein
MISAAEGWNNCGISFTLIPDARPGRHACHTLPSDRLWSGRLALVLQTSSGCTQTVWLYCIEHSHLGKIFPRDHTRLRQWITPKGPREQSRWSARVMTSAYNVAAATGEQTSRCASSPLPSAAYQPFDARAAVGPSAADLSRARIGVLKGWAWPSGPRSDPHSRLHPDYKLPKCLPE